MFGKFRRRRRYERSIENILTDIEQRHRLRVALSDLVKRLAEEMVNDGMAESEIKLLKGQLMRDVERVIIDLGEEMGR